MVCDAITLHKSRHCACGFKLAGGQSLRSSGFAKLAPFVSWLHTLRPHKDSEVHHVFDVLDQFFNDAMVGHALLDQVAGLKTLVQAIVFGKTGKHFIEDRL